MAALSQPGGAVLTSTDAITSIVTMHLHSLNQIGGATLVGYVIPPSTSHEYWSSQ